METESTDDGPTPGDGDFDAPADLFDVVLDRSGTGLMVFDADLRIAYVNDVAARVGVHPVTAPIGRRLVDLNPQLVVQVEPAVAEVLATRQPVLNRETVLESPWPPHERRYWMVSFVPVPGRDGARYVAAIYVETTPVRRAHERLATIIDALPTFVGMCSPDGTVTEVNEATLTAADLRRGDVVGQPLWEAPWWRDEATSRRRIHDAVMLAQEGRASRLDVAARIGDGPGLTLDFQLVPILERGAVTALLPSAVDITARVVERRRLEALAALSRDLNGAVTTEQATGYVVVHAPAITGATVASVALVDREHHVLRIDHGLPPEIAERWTVLERGGARTVWRDAIESGRTLVVDRASRAERYPDAVSDDLAGIDTTAAVPLIDAAGETFGAIGLGWAAPLVEPHHQVRLRLQLLADLCSDALRRVQRTDLEHRFVRQLQDEVLAAPDPSPELDVAVAYEPAQADIGFGGDWYDVIRIDDRGTAVVVGDVTGHGLAAAARMTEAKATIRAMVLTAAPDDVLPATTRSLAHLDSGFVATAAVAWIDEAASTVDWCLAGHLPPVLRTPDGETTILAGPHHPPIGMPTAPRPVSSTAFPSGSLLVLCTDGLVERRGTDLGDSVERLRALVESLPPGCSAAEASEVLRRELEADQSDDDVAIVVVRNR